MFLLYLFHIYVLVCSSQIHSYPNLLSMCAAMYDLDPWLQVIASHIFDIMHQL